MFQSFDVYGQAIYDADAKVIVSVELLARPKDGSDIVLEDYFRDLDPAVAFQWFLHQLSVAREFYRETGIPCSVNIDRNSIQYVKEYEAADDDDVAYSIELTQISDLPEALAIDKLFRERNSNIQIWLDDYRVSGILDVEDLLTTYDFDLVKLDPATPELLKTECGRCKIKLFNKIVNNKDIRVIVEGVESELQLDIFQDLGFRYFQGFYFHRPQPIDDLKEYIITHKIDQDGIIA